MHAGVPYLELSVVLTDGLQEAVVLPSLVGLEAQVSLQTFLLPFQTLRPAEGSSQVSDSNKMDPSIKYSLLISALIRCTTVFYILYNIDKLWMVTIPGFVLLFTLFVFLILPLVVFWPEENIIKRNLKTTITTCSHSLDCVSLSCSLFPSRNASAKHNWLHQPSYNNNKLLFSGLKPVHVCCSFRGTLFPPQTNCCKNLDLHAHVLFL